MEEVRPKIYISYTSIFMNFEKGKQTNDQQLSGIEDSEGADIMQIKRECRGCQNFSALYHKSGGKDMTMCTLRTVPYKEQVFFISLFDFGCAQSSLLYTDFHQLWWQGSFTACKFI